MAWVTLPGNVHLLRPVEAEAVLDHPEKIATSAIDLVTLPETAKKRKITATDAMELAILPGIAITAQWREKVLLFATLLAHTEIPHLMELIILATIAQNPVI